MARDCKSKLNKIAAVLALLIDTRMASADPTVDNTRFVVFIHFICRR